MTGSFQSHSIQDSKVSVNSQIAQHKTHPDWVIDKATPSWRKNQVNSTLAQQIRRLFHKQSKKIKKQASHFYTLEIRSETWGLNSNKQQQHTQLFATKSKVVCT